MKTITSFLLLLTIQPIFGQLSDGSILINGQFSYRSVKEKNDLGFQSYLNNSHSKTFTFIPGVDYFVSNNWSIGIGVGYTYEYNEFYYSTLNPDDPVLLNGIETNSIVLNPRVKGFKQLSDKIFLFESFDFFFKGGKRSNANGQDYLTKLIQVGTTPGIMFLMSDHLGITGSIGEFGYNYRETKNEDGERDQSKEFVFDFSLDTFQLGVLFYFSNQ